MKASHGAPARARRKEGDLSLEGPYDDCEDRPAQAAPDPEMHKFLALMEMLQDEFEKTLLLQIPQRELRMVIDLVRSHLAGRMVTISSLIASSGLSHGTAVRTIENLHRRALIIKRCKTRTGKSFSLHPSETLLLRWYEFPRFKVPQRRLPLPKILQPPSVLESRLSIAGALRMLVHTDPTFMAMHLLRKQLEIVLGARLETRALSIERLRHEIIDNSARRISKYDLVAVDLPWFGEMGLHGRLLPLDELMSQSLLERDDFYPEALASSHYKGRLYGVPILTTAEFFVYRSDILEACGCAPPKTTNDLLSVARRVHSKTSGISGVAWSGGRGTPMAHTFLMVMSAFGRPIVNLRPLVGGFDAENVQGEAARPLFTSPEAHQAAEFLLELKDHSTPNVLKMGWYERAQAYAQGACAMAYSNTMLAPLFSIERNSPAFWNTKYLPYPHGPDGRPIAPLGGYALSIPANIAPERVPAAWQALRTLTSANVAKLYLSNGSLMSPRLSVSGDPEVQALSPVIAAVGEMGRAHCWQMWPRPPIPEISDLMAIAGEEIHDLVSGVKTPKHALAAAQDRAEALMRSKGYY